MVNAAILTTINYFNDNSVNTLLHCNNYCYTELNKNHVYIKLKEPCHSCLSPLVTI